MKHISEILGDRPFYPLIYDIFKAYQLIRPENVKVIIVGQDPYHDKVNGHPRAMGLSFIKIGRCEIFDFWAW